VIEKYRIAARQAANVLPVDIAVEIEIEVRLAVAVRIERAFGSQEAQRDAERVVPPRSTLSSTKPPSVPSTSFTAAV
jgi:hypothetical protein